MERITDRIDKWTMRAVSSVLLASIDCKKTKMDAFEAFRKALVNKVTLAHLDPSQRLCVYTSAYDSTWTGTVTQFSRSDIHWYHQKQQHAFLSFLSG